MPVFYLIPNHITGWTTCFIIRFQHLSQNQIQSLTCLHWERSPDFVFACRPVQSSIPRWPFWTRWRPYGMVTLRRATTIWKCNSWNECFLKCQLHKGGGLCLAGSLSREPRCSRWGQTVFFSGFGFWGLFLRQHRHDTSVYWPQDDQQSVSLASPLLISLFPGSLCNVPISEYVYL